MTKNLLLLSRSYTRATSSLVIPHQPFYHPHHSLSSTSLRFYTVSRVTSRSKLGQILEDYRSENYRQETPTRFIKDILKAADENKDGYLERHEVAHLLENIGAQGKLSAAELDEFMTEILQGKSKDDKIPLDRVKEVMTQEVVGRKK